MLSTDQLLVPTLKQIDGYTPISRISPWKKMGVLIFVLVTTLEMLAWNTATWEPSVADFLQDNRWLASAWCCLWA